MTKRLVPLVAMLGVLSIGCSNFLAVVDTSGAGYARVRGTVTTASGVPVNKASIGISCVGSTADPFGLTTEANANGEFDFDIASPPGFQPLEGNTRICRVLTPVDGTPRAQVSLTVTFSESVNSRPTTQVTLVLP